MADTELSALTEDTFPAATDWFYKVDSGGTTDRKVARDNMRGYKIVRKTADESVTSSATLQNDDALTFAIAANEVWVVQYYVWYSCGTTGDIQFAVDAPASSTVLSGQLALAETATSNTGNLKASAATDGASLGGRGGPASTNTPTLIFATIANGANAGNVVLQWAQDVSDGTATTVKANSYLVAFRLA